MISFIVFSFSSGEREGGSSMPFNTPSERSATFSGKSAKRKGGGKRKQRIREGNGGEGKGEEEWKCKEKKERKNYERRKREERRGEILMETMGGFLQRLLTRLKHSNVLASS